MGWATVANVMRLYLVAHGCVMTTQCPVCDSYIDETVPTADTEYEGQQYYFESAKCKELFEANPGEYA